MWAFLDDRADEHPKLLAVGGEAAWYWACGLCYCRRNFRVPGFIPKQKALILYPVTNVKDIIAVLVEARLWHEVDGGYEVHEYGKIYGERQVDAELSRKRSEAGRLGGLRSGRTRRALGSGADEQIRHAARAAVQLALKDGSLSRQPCALCGRLRTEAHHADYSKPLDIVWLCKKHHDIEHVNNRQQNLAKTKQLGSATEATELAKNEAKDTRARRDARPAPARARGSARVAGALGSDSYTGSDLKKITATTTDLGSKPNQNSSSSSNSQIGSKTECPKDLRLSDIQHKRLVESGLPPWAIESLTVRFVVKSIGDPEDKRTLAAWRKSLVTAITCDWDNPARRPREPENEKQIVWTG
jgi:hypothetical protein